MTKVRAVILSYIIIMTFCYGGVTNIFMSYHFIIDQEALNFGEALAIHAAKFPHNQVEVYEGRFHHKFVFHCCEVEFFHNRDNTYKPFLFPSATNKLNHCLLMKYLAKLHRFLLDDPTIFKNVPDHERTVSNKSRDASYCKGNNFDANLWRICYNASIGLNEVTPVPEGAAGAGGIITVRRNDITMANRNFVILVVTAMAFVLTTGSCGVHTQTSTLEKMSLEEKDTFRKEMKHNAGYV